MVTIPPMIHTTPKSEVHETSAMIGPGVRKIPDPIIRPITMDTDSIRPRSRLYSVCSSKMQASETHFCSIVQRSSKNPSSFYRSCSQYLDAGIRDPDRMFPLRRQHSVHGNRRP